MAVLQWFGAPPPGTDGSLPRVATPVGTLCDFCHEPIQAEDSGCCLDDAHVGHAACVQEWLFLQEAPCEACHLLGHLAEIAKRDVVYASRQAHLQGPEFGVFVNLGEGQLGVFLANKQELLDAVPTERHPEVALQARAQLNKSPTKDMVHVLFVYERCFLTVHAPVLSQEALAFRESYWRNEDMLEYVADLKPQIEGLGQPGRVLVVALASDPLVTTLSECLGVTDATTPEFYVALHDLPDVLAVLPLEQLRDADVPRVLQTLSMGQRILAVNGEAMSTEMGWWVT